MPRRLCVVFLATFPFATIDATAHPIDPGTVIVADRVNGTLLFQPPDVLASNGIITGRTLGYPDTALVGTGPTITAANGHLSIIAVSGQGGSRLFARKSLNAGWGLFEISNNGDRSLVTSTDLAPWATGGDMLALDATSLLCIADDYNANALGSGRLFKYDINTQAVAQITGNLIGDGVDMHRPRSMTRLDATHVAIAEFGQFTGGALNGTVVYRVDLTNGNREVLSTISRSQPSRYTVLAGVRSAAPALVPLRGSGPTFNQQSRGITFVDNRLFVAGTTAIASGSGFAGGIIEIDLATGDRTLFVGTAVNEAGAIVTVPLGPNSAPEGLNAPASLMPMGADALVFVDPFLAKRVWRLDLATKQLSVLIDFLPQMGPPYTNTVAFSGVTVTPCDGSSVSIALPSQLAPACPASQILLTAQPSPAGATFAYTWELQNPDLSWSRIDNGSINSFAIASTTTTRTLTLDFVDALAAGRAVRVRVEGFCGSAVSEPIAIDIASPSECPNCSPCAADYDANGGVDGGDLGAFFVDFEAGATCADVDQNGGVDGGDLGTFFQAFEAGGC